MTGKANSVISLLCLVFIIDAATGASWVEDIKMEGSYGFGDCDARVTCYVYATDPQYKITWSCLGCAPGSLSKAGFAGIRVKDIEWYGYQKYRQTIIITECLGELKFTCSSGSSSRSITLLSLTSSSGALSVAVIVGIVFSVIVLLCLIGGLIGLLRTKKTRGVVVRSGIVNPVVQVNPPPGTYPAQPQPMVYPVTQHAMPRPHPEVN